LSRIDRQNPHAIVRIVENFKAIQVAFKMHGSCVWRGVALCYSQAPAMEKEVSTQPKTGITPEEYLERERQADIKSEFLRGEMFAMSGATRQHNAIAINILTELNLQFADRPRQVYGLDMRVKVDATGLYTYPDVVAICGELRFEDAQLDTLMNPNLIIEVLSNSSESYDRGKKFAHYRSIDSLKEYVLVSQNECRIERFSRQDDSNWLYSENTDPDSSIELSSVACRLSAARVYHKVDV
jgi:Uma2 family endonuclease